MSPFDSFDRDFAREERRFRRFSALITVGIATVWLALLGAIAAIVITFCRVGPDGLAREAGHLFATFMDAAREKQP